MKESDIYDASMQADEELLAALEAWRKAPQCNKAAARAEVLGAYKLAKLLDDACVALDKDERNSLVTAVWGED